MKIESSKLIRRAQSTRIYLWLPHRHTHAVPVADGIEMQLFYVAAPCACEWQTRFVCVCVCIVPQFDSTSRCTNMPRANRRQQTEMER